MSISAPLLEMAATQGLTTASIASQMECREEDVRRWLTGRDPVPPAIAGRLAAILSVDANVFLVPPQRRR